MILDFFDSGLDEMAAGAHASAVPRLGATLGVSLIALAFLPWQGCLAWAALVGGTDLFSWFITTDQARGRPVTMAKRLQHVGCLVGGVTGWVTLGALFWRTGTAAGEAAAA